MFLQNNSHNRRRSSMVNPVDRGNCTGLGIFPEECIFTLVEDKHCIMHAQTINLYMLKGSVRISKVARTYLGTYLVQQYEEMCGRRSVRILIFIYTPRLDKSTFESAISNRTKVTKLPTLSVLDYYWPQLWEWFLIICTCNCATCSAIGDETPWSSDYLASWYCRMTLLHSVSIPYKMEESSDPLSQLDLSFDASLANF